MIRVLHLFVFFIFFITETFFFSFLKDTCCSEPEFSYRPEICAIFLKKPLIIDGSLYDWPKEAEEVEMVLDPESEDYRGTARVVWDKQYLYVAFVVNSGKKMCNDGDNPSLAFKTGDTVEVFLSVNEAPLKNRVPRGVGLDTAKEGDYRILMTLLKNRKPVVFGYDFVNPLHKENPIYFRVAGPEASIDRSGVVPGAILAVKEVKRGNVTTGYATEAKIPWRYFRNYNPKIGDRLLFNLAINFSNKAGTSNIAKAYWSGPNHITSDAGVEAQVYPETWGWLLLK